MSTFQSSVFQESDVEIEGNDYVNCLFDKCRIIYRGGSISCVGCTFRDCQWHFEGAAAATIEVLRMLLKTDTRESIEELLY